MISRFITYLFILALIIGALNLLDACSTSQRPACSPDDTYCQDIQEGITP